MNSWRLICTIGLPRSGKTTWAKLQGHPIVNPDSIRLALHGQRFQAVAEPFVWAIAQLMVRALFLAGHNTVILDATNNTQKRREMWLSEDWETEWHNMGTPAEECRLRAKLSGDDYILPVIDRMEAEAVASTAEDRRRG